MSEDVNEDLSERLREREEEKTVKEGKRERRCRRGEKVLKKIAFQERRGNWYHWLRDKCVEGRVRRWRERQTEIDGVHLIRIKEGEEWHNGLSACYFRPCLSLCR